LLQHPRFRAAYDFLLLRAEIDPSLQKLSTWWTKAEAQRQPSQPRRRKKSINSAASSQHSVDNEHSGNKKTL
jgi:poly(A) polymerase